MLSELKKEFLPSALFTFGNIAQFFRGGGGGPLPPHLARIRVEIPCCGGFPQKMHPPRGGQGQGTADGRHTTLESSANRAAAERDEREEAPCPDKL